MRKNRTFIAVTLLVVFICCAGCSTCKGFKQDVSGLTKGELPLWQKLKDADAWFQEHYW
ncbi:hypothetical protein ACFL38_03960 [Candidatus Omnitrophota bacterium]